MRNFWITIVILLILTGCDTKKPAKETETIGLKDTAAILPNDTTNQKVEENNPPMGEPDFGGVGELSLGLSHTKIIALLGQPVSKSKNEEWGADGLLHQDWLYNDKGIALNMSSEKGKPEQYVFSITISSPCTYKTKKNMGIGSTYKEVSAAYDKEIDKTSTDFKSIVVGSVYGGIIFTFGKDDRAESIFIGAAAE